MKDEAYHLAEQKIAEALKTGATELDLRNMQLTELPDSLGQLTQLTELNLSNNQLTTLPDWLGQLSQLRTLTLFSNQLNSLPESIGQLANLVVLSIFRNKMTTLPNELFAINQLQSLRIGENPFTKSLDFLEWRKLINLEELQIDGLGLTALPNWLEQLKNLKLLFIDNNQISDISSLFATHPNLTWLGLGGSFGEPGNPLKMLPDDINRLTLLEHITASDCELTIIPPSLAQLEHLTRLDLNNNPLNPALQSAYDACKNKEIGGKHE
jgi:internalin A